MSFSALVIGFGSIGKRHAEIMNAMDEIAHLSVLSSQSGLPYDTLSSLEEIPRLNPDYAVIASSTVQHYEQLNFLEKNLEGKIISTKTIGSAISFDIKIKGVSGFYMVQINADGYSPSVIKILKSN